jgi:hypothetical protein
MYDARNAVGTGFACAWIMTIVMFLFLGIGKLFSIVGIVGVAAYFQMPIPIFIGAASAILFIAIDIAHTRKKS